MARMLSRNRGFRGLLGMDRIDDMNEALAEMQRLHEEAGDWRRHLPYEALTSWQRNAEIRARFLEHVESCSFCREIIDALSQANDG